MSYKLLKKVAYNNNCEVYVLPIMFMMVIDMQKNYYILLGVSMIKEYEEHKGILEKKVKNIWGGYIFIVNDGTKTVSVKVAKTLYDMYQLNSQVTIGYIGKKLINIRPSIISANGE